MANAKKPRLPDDSTPEASLYTLLHMLGIQVMIALGEVKNPVTGETTLDVRQARFHFDTIRVLYEKTEGKRTPEETAAFENVMHEITEVLARKAP